MHSQWKKNCISFFVFVFILVVCIFLSKEPDSEFKTHLFVNSRVTLHSPHMYTVKGTIEYNVMGNRVVQFRLRALNGPLKDFRVVSLCYNVDLALLSFMLAEPGQRLYKTFNNYEFCSMTDNERKRF